MKDRLIEGDHVRLNALDFVAPGDEFQTVAGWVPAEVADYGRQCNLYPERTPGAGVLAWRRPTASIYAKAFSYAPHRYVDDISGIAPYLVHLDGVPESYVIWAAGQEEAEWAASLVRGKLLGAADADHMSTMLQRLQRTENYQDGATITCQGYVAWKVAQAFIHEGRLQLLSHMIWTRSQEDALYHASLLHATSCQPLVVQFFHLPPGAEGLFGMNKE